MKEMSERLIERWYHEMWNQWNKDIFAEILDERIFFRGSLGMYRRSLALNPNNKVVRQAINELGGK